MIQYIPEWDILQTRRGYLTHQRSISYERGISYTPEGDIIEKKGDILQNRQEYLIHQSSISHKPEGYIIHT
jgi:hypothetical protein